MSWRYFEAGEPDINARDKTCAFCADLAPCLYSQAAQVYGCLDCFGKRRFSVYHVTTLGFLDQGKLSIYEYGEGAVEVDPPEGFSREALVELGYSPPFRSHQGEATFPTHCDDFMAYVGRWEPDDFRRERPDDPRALYEVMAGDADLWDQTIEEERRHPGDWQYQSSRWAHGAWVYVFRCLACGEKRSNWDCD